MVCAAELWCVLKYLSKHDDVKDLPPSPGISQSFLYLYMGSGTKII